MTVAALLYSAGWLAIVIATGDATPLALRLVTSLPAHVEPADVAAHVVRLLRAHGVARAYVERPRESASVAGPLAATLAAALAAAGIEAEHVGVEWRERVHAGGGRGGAKGGRSIAGNAFADWPVRIEGAAGPMPTPASCALAGALLASQLPGVAAKFTRPAPSSPPLAPAALATSAELAAKLAAGEPPWRHADGTTAPPGGTTVPCAETSAPASAAARTLPLPYVEAAPGVPRIEVVSVPTKPPEPAPPAPAPAPAGRLAGIDPGARHVAIVIADPGAPLHVVAARAWEVGRSVPLAKPRTIKRADGSTREQTHRREVTDEDVETLLVAIVAFLRAHGPVERAAVERATHLHANKGGAAVGAMLARAQWIGGEIAGTLRAAGVLATDGVRPVVERVETVSSKRWRASVCKAHSAATWKDGVRAAFDVEPTGEHVRDAAGVAAWLARPRAERAPVVPATPAAMAAARSKRNASKDAKRKEKRAKDRAASGCTCSGRRRHARTCALYTFAPNASED